ncbi:MAG: hypothetical protein GDA36_12415 [Rhodobacteraceae bacterium]|nr:hypothetical protein [Paracoccaceae bacterium]
MKLWLRHVSCGVRRYETIRTVLIAIAIAPSALPRSTATGMSIGRSARRGSQFNTLPNGAVAGVAGRRFGKPNTWVAPVRHNTLSVPQEEIPTVPKPARCDLGRTSGSVERA